MQKMYPMLFLMMLIVSACAPASQQDLLVNSVSNRATADAAIQQAQLQEQFMTATAQAPIIHITSTAAAFAMQQSYAAATSTAAAQQQALAMTTTAQSWTPTPNATTTAIFLALNAQSTQTALALQRQEISNQFNAIRDGVFLISLLLFAIVLLMLTVRRERHKPATVDERGRIMPIIDVVHGTVTDIERMPNYRGSMVENLLMELLRQKLNLPAPLPQITAERQDRVTSMSQLVDMGTRARLPRRLLEAQGLLDPDADERLLPAGDEPPLLIEYPLPEWNPWMQNWKPGHLALGINENGLLQADPEQNPHFLFAGTTGSWKTRGGVRVLVTCALASGWQVIIAGKDLDYRVFENHPNAHLLPFSMLKDPTRAIELLRSVYAEIERRNNMMSHSGHSLWAQMGKSRTMVVVDEFSNLADALEDIGKERRQELWRWARMDTAEARKFGIHMVYALQDPTAQSIDLRIRRNTTPVMFRVKDAASSRTLLNTNGAELLSARHFLTVMLGLERGAAFAPSDEEISQFLTQHPVNKVSDDEGWIDGVISDAPAKLRDQSQTPEDAPPASLDQLISSLNDEGLRIIEMHQAGHSLNEIQRQVIGHTGGAAYNKVSEIIRQYKAATSTTTPEMSLQDAAGQ